MHICLEGPNGSGKTTLLNKFSENGYRTLSSPNGTILAKYVREAARGAKEWNNLSEIVKFHLFAAARCDEFNQLIKPYPNEIIICDRWHFSSWIYQCQFGNVPVNVYEASIQPEEHVDCVFILTASPKTLIKRVNKEREINTSHSKCSYTKQEETLFKIHNLYETKLPIYLTSRKIKNQIIYTEKYNPQQIFEYVKEEIKKL